ncbi:D-alanyl-D-alanine carboxypeptidase family protein [Patescibacteria group bacterium]|nr:D-alanyl-D-alanine carboxypeptidase family protein [Patescibacteria group bacterium]
MESKQKTITWHTVVAVIGILVAIGLFSYGGYRYHLLQNQNVLLGNSISELEGNISQTQNRNSELLLALDTSQKQLESLTGQIDGISSTVGTLQKLAQTDPELLKKYSKIYFLNENYLPVGLSDIDASYIFEKGKNILFHTSARLFLDKLLAQAKNDNQDLKVVSGYRSFSNQAGLKSAYKMTYGSGANKFSADQGYSEHQLGTAIDFTTSKVGASFVGFEKTPEYSWLKDNAWKYGFIESYPPNNSYYVFESWHWRFVGIKLAQMLHEEKKHFYDIDQRKIDSYLITLFDN